MFQVKELNKHRGKRSVFEAKKGKTFVTPENRSCIFDYEIIGKKYIVILEYNGAKMQISEPDYLRTNTDSLLKTMEHESNNPIS